MLVNNKRIHRLNAAPVAAGPILYWMSREQRVRDNWGTAARARAGRAGSRPRGRLLPGSGFSRRDPCASTTSCSPGWPRWSPISPRWASPLSCSGVIRAGRFPGWPQSSGAGGVVTDFDPLRVKQGWQRAAGKGSCSVALIEVDGHNVVPARQVSPKQEYAARTIRPKIHRLIGRVSGGFSIP